MLFTPQNPKHYKIEHADMWANVEVAANIDEGYAGLPDHGQYLNNKRIKPGQVGFIIGAIDFTMENIAPVAGAIVHKAPVSTASQCLAPSCVALAAAACTLTQASAFPDCTCT